MENDVFLYNDVEQRVERVLMKLVEGGSKYQMRFTMALVRGHTVRVELGESQLIIHKTS